MNRDTPHHGERRWTAVLCADLVNFTGMSKTLGPERTYEIMREIVAEGRAEIERYSGDIIEFAGDAIFAVFGAPTATENASLDACRAALSFQARIKSRQPYYLTKYGVSPGFRIGLAGGSVVFGSLGDGEGLDINVLGDAVNLSTRMQKTAQKGAVVCSSSIIEQVEGFVVSTDLGQHELKGFDGLHHVYGVERLIDGITYFEGRMQRGAEVFVGREAELNTLKDWSADTSGARLIEISGAPGAGKSRLVYEFLAKDKLGETVLIGQCNENVQKTPLAPVIEIIRNAIGWVRGEARDVVGEKLMGLLGQARPGFDFLTDRVGSFAQESPREISGNENGIAVRDLCGEILEILSKDKRATFLIEDVHWIDPVSASVITAKLNSPLSATRFITTRRAHIPAEWVDREDIACLPLSTLSREMVRDMVTSMLDFPVGDDVASLVADKSECNPLFVEEIVRYLRFADCIEFESGTATLIPDSYQDIISGNLQHLVLNRFDALSRSDRALLAIASGRGRRFSVAFLNSCAEDDSSVFDAVERAHNAGLVERDPTGNEGDYRFSHALIQDAVYDSLLGPRKKEIHAIIAAGLEANSGQPSELAYHFQAAGNDERAVHYLHQSAEKAFEVFAVVQVDGHLETAFSIIETQPDIVDDQVFGRMLFLWGRTLDVYGNFRKLIDVMRKHTPRLREAEQLETLSLCLCMKALAQCHAAQFERSQEILSEALEISEENGFEIGILWAKTVQMRLNVDAGYGTTEETTALYEEVKPGAERLDDSHLLQLSTYIVTAANRADGALKKAERYVDWLVEFGEARGSKRALAMASWARCLHCLVRDDVDGAIEAADENLRLTVPNTADWRVAAVCRKVAQLGRRDEGVEPEDLEPFLETMRADHDTTLRNAVTIQYVIAIISRGRFYEGWRGIKETQDLFDTGATPEIQRFLDLVRAEVLMALGGVLPARGERPKMGPMDILTALWLKLSAKRRAAYHLKRFIEASAVRDSGHFVARVKRNFALLAKSRGKVAEANQLFDESIALYEAEDMFDSADGVRAMRD